ncbi:MAG: hypothetical protein RSB82_04850 [Victivallaceae bacterium]
MLYDRCLSQLAREAFGDVVKFSVYTREELKERKREEEARTFIPIPDDMKISNILFSPFAQRRREE